MVKLGDVIRDLRDKQHLSQIALADKAGCSQQTIGKIETYKTSKSGNLPNIAKALGTTAEAILAQVDEEISEPARQGKRATTPKRKSRARWPFDAIKYELFDALSLPQQLEIELLIFAKINEFKVQNLSTTHHRKRPPIKRASHRESEDLHQHSSGSTSLPKRR